MLDSGFMPPFRLCSSDRNVTGEDVLLPLGRKQRCLCLRAPSSPEYEAASSCRILKTVAEELRKISCFQ